MYKNTKKLFHKEKTIRFSFCHLSPFQKTRLQRGKLQPHEMIFKNIAYDVKRDTDMEYYLDLGYKVVFNYLYKDYLLIFNK